MVITILPIVYVRQAALLRPSTAPLLSWEMALFELSRGPWILAGVTSGLLQCLQQRSVEFRVTNKHGQAAPLPLTYLLPYALLTLVGAGVALLAGAGAVAAKGYVLLTLVATLMLAATALMITILSQRGGPHSLRSYLPHYLISGGGVLLTLGSALLRRQELLVPLGSAGAGAVATPFGGRVRKLGPALLLAISLATSALLVKFSTMHSHSQHRQPLLVGIYQPEPGPGPELQGSQKLRLSPLFLNWSAADALAQLDHFLNNPSQAKRLSLITVEPFANQAAGRSDHQLVSDIENGLYDPQIVAIGKRLASHRKPLLLRFGHEMDQVGQYPWSISDGDRYVRMLRHVHATMAPTGISNVRWVWSPAGNRNADQYWPGDQYVDLIGISIYSSRGFSADGSLPSFTKLYEEKRWLHERYRKPVLLAEIGVSDSATDKQAWLK
jgi:cellulose synthase (UDP-forming)